MHFEVFTGLIIELKLRLIKALLQDANVDLIWINNVWVLQFVFKLHLQFCLERWERCERTRGENDWPGIKRLYFSEAYTRIKAPKPKHTLRF